MKTELYQKEIAKNFYEDRYDKGYMDDWPVEKKKRVFDIIKSLSLPDTGIALDFGCGSGVFTEVLKNALKNWQIYGCDISLNAIKNAKIRCPECCFYESGNNLYDDLKYDFIFSHHVLEHVYDIDKVIFEICNMLKLKSSILFILPCGNKGSFEYNICKMRHDGINRNMENRFFFEDEGHVRRLTTKQVNTLVNDYGLELSNEYYSNQYYGAIKWITQYSLKFILYLTNSKKSSGKKNFRYLFYVRFKLILLYLLQQPVLRFNRMKLLKNKKLKHYISGLIYLCLIPLSYPIYYTINNRADNEWNINKHFKNGSEMYLFYNRI